MVSDCYYMSAIYSFAENDQRFQKAFVNKQSTKSGIYAINAYVRGKPTIITVDDYIPFSGDTPIFAGFGLDGSNWGPIIEKVWAKVNGNYERINNGYPSEAMRFLTGCPTTYTDLTTYGSPDDIWNILVDSDNNNYIAIAGTTGGADSTTNSYGLANGHAYSMLGVY